MTIEVPPAPHAEEKPKPPRPPELSASPADRRALWIVGLVVAVIVLLLLGGGVLLFLNPPVAQVLRDITIIFLGLLSLLIILLLLALVVVLTYLTLKINDLVQLLSREIQPLLVQANEAASRANDAVRTVHSRTVLISDEVVRPVINVASYAAATRAIIRALFRRN